MTGIHRLWLEHKIQETLSEAKELARLLGKYVTPADALCAFIVLEED
jgi:hypothetical protein